MLANVVCFYNDCARVGDVGTHLVRVSEEFQGIVEKLVGWSLQHAELHNLHV